MTTAVVDNANVEQIIPPVVAPSAVDAAAIAAAVAAELAKGKEPTTVTITDPEVVTYPETGDPGLDMALEFVGKLGISDTHPAIVAAVDGNFDLLKAHFGGLGDKAKGWERYVALAEKSFAESSAATAKTQGEINAAVFEAAGSEDQWNTIKAWASSEATPAEKLKINALLSAGAWEAGAAAASIVAAYNKKVGTAAKPANAVKPNSSAQGGTAAVQERLTKRGYALAVDVLARKYGSHNLDRLPEYAALNARYTNQR